MKNILLLLFAVFLIFNLSNCNYDQTSPKTEVSCDTINVSFSADVLPLFLNNCVASGCHNTADAQAGVDLSSYDVVIAVDTTWIIDAITWNGNVTPMPFGEEQLPSCDIALIEAWIHQGSIDYLFCTRAREEVFFALMMYCDLF